VQEEVAEAVADPSAFRQGLRRRDRAHARGH
jgi:hypothetical protein